MKFTIDRAIWLNASAPYGMGSTLLHNKQGNMCCLGFVCEQLGVPRENLTGVDTPGLLDLEELPDSLAESLSLLRQGASTDTELSSSAMDLNDSDDYTPVEREKLLSQLFRNYGHELEFTGAYPDAEVVSSSYLADVD